MRSWFVDELGSFRGLFWVEAELKLVLEPQNSSFLFESMDSIMVFLVFLFSQRSNFIDLQSFVSKYFGGRVLDHVRLRIIFVRGLDHVRFRILFVKCRTWELQLGVTLWCS